MPPKQPVVPSAKSAAAPVKTVIDQLITDIAKPERFTFDDHVRYFSNDFIQKIRATASNLSTAEAAITKYIDYLTTQVTREESARAVKIQHCAYLIGGVSNLLALRLSVSLKDPLSNLVNALAQHWLELNSGELRYQVQFFYNFVKLLKQNTLHLNPFFGASNFDTPIIEKINILFLKLVTDGNTQDIANVFLALGYLAQQGKTYDIPAESIHNLLSRLLTLNPNTQEIANVFLALGYLAQCFPAFAQPDMTTAYTLYCTALFKKKPLLTYCTAEISQLVIATYRIYHTSNVQVLAESDLKALEAELKTQKPTPNALQLGFSEQLIKLNQKTELEALICGFFVDLLIPDKKIIIEFDGPQHYQENGSLCTEDALRDALLEIAGYTVIRIKNNAANALMKNENSLRDRLTQIIGTPTCSANQSNAGGEVAGAAAAATTPAAIIVPVSGAQTQGLFKPAPKKAVKKNKSAHQWHEVHSTKK